MSTDFHVTSNGVAYTYRPAALTTFQEHCEPTAFEGYDHLYVYLTRGLSSKVEHSYPSLTVGTLCIRSFTRSSKQEYPTYTYHHPSY